MGELKLSRIVDRTPCARYETVTIQLLIQKEKVDVDGEKSAQISIAAKNIVTQR